MYIHDGVLLGNKKKKKKEILTICENMDGSWRYYAKWNNSDRERQIPYYFTYMLNLKMKTNEQTKQNKAHSYREQIGSYQRKGWLGIRKMVKEIKRFKLPVIKWINHYIVIHNNIVVHIWELFGDWVLKFIITRKNSYNFVQQSVVTRM